MWLNWKVKHFDAFVSEPPCCSYACLLHPPSLQISSLSHHHHLKAKAERSSSTQRKPHRNKQLSIISCFRYQHETDTARLPNILLNFRLNHLVARQTESAKKWLIFTGKLVSSRSLREDDYEDNGDVRKWNHFESIQNPATPAGDHKAIWMPFKLWALSWQSWTLCWLDAGLKPRVRVNFKYFFYSRIRRIKESIWKWTSLFS